MNLTSQGWFLMSYLVARRTTQHLPIVQYFLDVLENYLPQTKLLYHSFLYQANIYNLQKSHLSPELFCWHGNDNSNYLCSHLSSKLFY